MITEPTFGGRAEAADAWFRDLQTRICAAFEAFEPECRFEARSWRRPTRV